ncbi:helix-turn-helix transcriptional regulator [Candidatus Woesearchaeota archaeon]|nr:helix-turn-helix transcriptional regulator [Candidatus Woesearchaeota archaeon]
MADESFILVSLKEDKAKKLAQVITNTTSRKILDFLATKEATESEIAKKLDVPISTIHYSLKLLKEVNLVQVDEFHYSEKGKVVDHYKVSNKTVIISPSTPEGDSFKEKLKRLIPTVLVTGIVTGFLKLFNDGFFSRTNVAQERMLYAVADDTASDMIMAKAAPIAFGAGVEQASFTISPVLWFAIGAVVAVSVYFVTDIIITKIKTKRGLKK